MFGGSLVLWFHFSLSGELLTERCFGWLTDYEVLAGQRRQLTRLQLNSLDLSSRLYHTRLLLIIRIRLRSSNDGCHHISVARLLILTNDRLLILHVML